MAEAGIVGNQTNVVTEYPADIQARRKSSVVTERRASVVRAFNILHGDTAKNPNLRASVSEGTVESDKSDPYFNLKQAHGETHAEGGDTRWYKPIDTYEGRHRWDPTAEWSDQEEKKIIRKLDLRICAWCCLMFFALQLDRGNIIQALSDNMLKDLKLNTNDYNYGQIIFYVSFLSAELPSQMISKKLGPDNWIPIQMVCWSIVAICQSMITGKSTFFLTRSLLGLIEGGFIPDVILYLSYFYKSKELPIRLSFFWSAYICTSIISAFLAFGILRLRGHHGWEGWRWLFALEGALTASIGIASWFYLPPSPCQTASFFRGKDGWFTEREEVIMVNRVLRDDPSKGDMHNRQGLSLRLLWEALSDYDLWPLYILGLTVYLPNAPNQAYLSLIIRSLGFDTFETNLLTIPAFTLFLLQLLFWTWFSEKINNRFLCVSMAQFWMLPLFIALVTIPTTAPKWGRYTLSLLLYGYPYVHAILVAITSRNAGSVRTRTVASALYNMCVQTGQILSSLVYQNDDKPYYHRGLKICLAVASWNVVYIFAIKAYYVWRNKSRDKIWNSFTDEQKQEYLETTKDKGNKRLDFRFAH